MIPRDLADRGIFATDPRLILIDVLIGNVEAEGILAPAAHMVEGTALRAAARPERGGRENREGDQRERYDDEAVHGFLPFQGMRVHAH